MKKHIEELNNSITRKEQEKAALQSQIEALQDQCVAEKQTKQDALANGDNAAYLAAHRKIQDYESQIQGLQALIADKEKVSIKPEIIKALNAEITDFEDSRKKAIKKYCEAKRDLAEMFVSACRAENELKAIRNDFMQMGNISEYSGEIKTVASMEPHFNEATRFLKEELTAMGYNFTAIVTGQQTF